MRLRSGSVWQGAIIASSKDLTQSTLGRERRLAWNGTRSRLITEQRRGGARLLPTDTSGFKEGF